MRDSISSIQQDGYSEPLLGLVKRWRIQRLSIECMKTYKEKAFTLFNYNGLCRSHEGIATLSSSMMLEFSMNQVIEVDVQSHRLLRVNGEVANGIEHNRVLDLNDDGERWEGDVLNNQPFGWGVLYDSEGEKAYEGFRIGGVSVCYGTRYYADIQKVEYEGEWCEGKRWGRGIQYDRNGDVIIDGEWVSDDYKIEKHVVMTRGFFSLHSHIEELIVTNDCCNERERTALDLSFMSNLRLLEVGDDCFENVRRMRLIGLSQLERVLIGKDCFKEKNDIGYNPNCHFYLKNCERVKELKIGRYSFNDYSICEIENVPSLEVIEMGELNEFSDSFHNASLELKSDSQGMK